MKVRIHLVVEDTSTAAQARDRRIDLTTVIDSGSPYGQDPVIGSIRAASDLAVSAVKEVTR